MAAPDPLEARNFASLIVRQLHDAGYVAFWAGGCVRDQLLGFPPKDYDVATNALPDDVCRVFVRRKTIRVGVSFGVVTVVGGRRAGNVEVATFRRDDGYSDGRHPDRVSFSSAEEDAQRRDFTINGMFFDPLSSQVIDYVGGQNDLRNRIVRCIGDPLQRFTEDKLRLLRAIRFAAVFDFELDARTMAAIRHLASTISVVSAERIANEMRRMLADPHRTRALELLQDSGLRSYILPEFGGPTEDTSRAWSESISLCGLLGGLPVGPIEDHRFELATAALLWPLARDGSSESIVSALAERWKLSNRERDLIELLIRNEIIVRQADSSPWSTVQPVLIDPAARDVAALARAVAKFRGEPETGVEFCERELTQSIENLNPEPLLNGDDLLRLGMAAGPRLGAILAAIRSRQLDGEIRDRKEAIESAIVLWKGR